MQLLAYFVRLATKNKSNQFQAKPLFLNGSESYLNNFRRIQRSFRPQFFKMQFEKYGIKMIQDQTPYLTQLAKYLFYFKICKDKN